MTGSRIYKIMIAGLLIIIPAGLLNAQQKPVFSQYMMNKFLINPAFAGNSGHTSVNLTARQQYSGFANPPRTFLLSGQTRLLEDSWILRVRKVRKKTTQASRSQNVGLGGYIYNDRNGLISRTGFQLTYAYHINFKNAYQLSFGLSGSGFQYKLDATDATLTHPDDPLLLNAKNTFFVPDANAGIYISGRGFYSGLSITELFGSYVKLGKNKFENYKTLRHFYLITGYKIAVSNYIILEPSFLAQATIDNFQLDISTRVFYLRNYWIGFTYRTNNTLVSMVGFKYDGLFFGYAYDANLSNMRSYGGGSHELMLEYRIGSSNTRRARWLRPDVSEIGE